jgi:hypothetical protein
MQLHNHTELDPEVGMLWREAREFLGLSRVERLDTGGRCMGERGVVEDVEVRGSLERWQGHIKHSALNVWYIELKRWE